MPLIKLYKFRELDEMQNFLAGGIVGTSDIVKPRPEGPAGIPGIVGKKLTFVNPAGSVTFTAGTQANGFLLFGEIKAQIEAAVAGVKVYQVCGRLAFIQKTPSTGIVLKGDGTVNTSANNLLGFDINNNAVGKVYDSPFSDPPTVPYMISSYNTNDNIHVVMTFE